MNLAQRGWLVPARRLQQVALVLARHGFGELVSRIGIGLAGLPKAAAAEARAARADDRLPLRVARVLADLGPTYIKLGQLLATREDIFTPPVTRALASLHSSVRPLPPRTAVRAVRQALGRPLDDVFAHFDPLPLAAASIAQVHRARLRAGTPVVVKVQRPGLARTIEADLAIMRLVARLLAEASPEIGALDPAALVAAFECSIHAELDFRNEAANAARLAALLGDADEVCVPRIHAEWTRATLLVMEEVQGRRLSDLAPPERGRIRVRLLRAFVRQILEHGVFHADPHPGNLLVREGRVVLLDLGAVETLERPLRRELSRLVRALVLGRGPKLASAVLALSPDGRAPGIDRGQLERDVMALVATSRQAGTGARVLTQMVALGRRHRLRMEPALLALVRALALLDGVLRGLEPARDLLVDLRREVARSVLRRLRRALTALARWFRRRFSPGAAAGR